MKLSKYNYKIAMVTVLTVTIFLSCKDNLKEVQQLDVLQNQPIGEAYNINPKYTDSGMLKAHLMSPKMLDYSNRTFAYSEFPEGIHLIIYDDGGNQSHITSDYAIQYDQTDLIDLRRNVKLTTHNKDTLYAEQLYYDQKRQWIFTNYPVELHSQGNVSKGNIFDSDRNFRELQVSEGSGDLYVQEE